RISAAAKAPAADRYMDFFESSRGHHQFLHRVGDRSSQGCYLDQGTERPFRGTTLLTVTPQLNSITVTPAGQTIPQGTALQLTATGNYADASTADLTGQVTWASTDQTIATIVHRGLATASSNNTDGTLIHATYTTVT